MTVRIAINGLGRIGRSVLRAAFEYKRSDIEIVAVNGPAPTDTHIHLLKYDSTHGRFPDVKKINEGLIQIAGKDIPVFHERDASKIPWGKFDTDIVLECTGVMKGRKEAGAHIASGAKKVIISAPADEVDATIVYGVNNEALQAEHKIISIGSCTTNCLAPVAKILNDAIGIENGFMTTIHAYTNDQNILDGTHKDLRRARTAGSSIIPTSTGAAKAIGLVIPQLKGKLDGIALRVPTPNVSLIDLTFNSIKKTNSSEINSIIEKAASTHLQGVLEYNTEQLVSIDFNHNPHSAIFDAIGTKVVGDNFCRIAAWYDNEWGFSVRMIDVAVLFGN